MTTANNEISSHILSFPRRGFGGETAASDFMADENAVFSAGRVIEAGSRSGRFSSAVMAGLLLSRPAARYRHSARATAVTAAITSLLSACLNVAVTARLHREILLNASP